LKLAYDIRFKIIVDGTSITQKFADQIGANVNDPDTIVAVEKR
jgi:methanogenic corrinoid protein MtbC1